MSDLISRSALIERLWEHHKGIKANSECYTDADEVADEICNCVSFIDEQPTVEAIPKSKLDEIVERLEEEKKNNIDWITIESLYYDGKVVGLEDAIEICKEVGRTNE